MKAKIQLAALVLVSSFILHPSSLLAQGSLTPPGAPAPTMKTLTQIEPRTPISSLPIIITQPGSYYLTASFDLSSGDGIFISAPNVTIDLNGFTIRSFDPTNASAGIRINTPLFGSFDNITILNGHIVGSVVNAGGSYAGSGFGYGIYSAGSPRNVRVIGVTVSGCLYDGIKVSSFSDLTTIVESCAVRTVGGAGIVSATVKGSVATDCGCSAAIIGNQVSDCQGQSSGSGDGIFASSAQNCTGSSNGGTGVNAANASNCNGSSSGSGTGVDAFTAQSCSGSSNTGIGVNAYTAQNCYGTTGGNAGYGLHANNANNCYGICFLASGYGLYAEDIAIGCSGYSFSGTGLHAFIANSSYGPSNVVTHPYNMP